MRDFLTITKALSDENRLRVLCALDGRELCVCQIIELLGLAASTVSRHISLLHQARLVERRKQGRWIYYRLADGQASEPVRTALAWTIGSLADDAQIRRDRKRLRRILECAPEDLCRRQQQK